MTPKMYLVEIDLIKNIKKCVQSTALISDVKRFLYNFGYILNTYRFYSESL